MSCPACESSASPLELVIGVGEAAALLGVSAAAVVRAAQLERIAGKKIGRSWVLLRRSVEAYQVTEVRVRAGKSARSTTSQPGSFRRSTG